MTTLHLISLPLDLRSFRRWSAQRNLSGDEGAALHHLLCESFGKSALQPFRLMVAPGAASATLYAYTDADRASLVQTAQETGMPDALAVCDPTLLAVKAMPPTWTKARRLAFDLRVRPVKRLMKPAGVFPKGAEVDAFLLEALRRHPDGPSSEDKIDRETVYRNWLAERFGDAAMVTQSRIVRLERSTVSRNGKRCEGPDVTFHGEIVIRDSEAFVERLARGVGRHAAYGYGMLLLRPSGK
jgi:CRISPR system Cascade subunit CasE